MTTQAAEARRAEIAERLFSADWPKDKWSNHQNVGATKGPDAAARRYLMLADVCMAELSRLQAALAAREEMKLVDFAEGMIQDAFDGHDVEGSDIQERAVACGLIIETTYSYERHGENEVDPKDGDPWYEFSPAFKAAIHASSLAARPTPASGEEVGQWRPIESAPTNGTIIQLAWCPDDWTSGPGMWRGNCWVAAAAFYDASAPHPRMSFREHVVKPIMWHPLPVITAVNVGAPLDTV
jgi:hypothetical protein